MHGRGILKTLSLFSDLDEIAFKIRTDCFSLNQPQCICSDFLFLTDLFCPFCKVNDQTELKNRMVIFFAKLNLGVYFASIH